MSNVPSASSSDDLLRARAFAVRLTSAALAEDASPRPAAGYVRFRPPGTIASAPTAPPIPAAPGPAPEPPRVSEAPVSPPVSLFPFVSEVGETRSRRIERFLSWTGDVCGSPVVLLMDSYALLIGARGPVTQEQAEGIGAHLMVALETAGRMVPDGTEAPTIAVAFGSLWLTGFRATLEGDEVVTFGVIGEQIPEIAARGLVAESAGMVL